jgi:hypothetical protein
MEDVYKEYNYPAAGKLYAILKDKGMIYTLNEVKDFIKKQEVAQVHKKVQKKRKRNLSITANAPNEIFQIDLLDYQKYPRQNSGYKWILICVDVFTRKAYTQAMKDKTAKMTEEAFKSIIMDAKPKVVFHDMGSEFKGVFHKFVESKKIISVDNEFKNHNALGVIDRFSRTIKTMISKYMTANNTTRWVDILPKLTSIYNNTPHQGILDLKPNEVADGAQNQVEIATLNIDKQIRNNRIRNNTKHHIDKGDTVRIRQEKGTFAKGYEITFSKDVYVVDDVKGDIAIIEGIRYPLHKLMIVPEDSAMVDMTMKQQVDRSAKIKRKVRKEGIDDYLTAGKFYK